MTSDGFLSHLRVVEGSAFVAAPFAGLTLAQMGAEVVRFDLPGGGLDYRRMPRHPETGASHFWAGLNKGKKSVAIDFRTEEGAELVQQLVTAPGEGAGLFLTNFAGVPWLDHEALAARRPDLISLSITGNHDGSSEVDYTVNPAVGIPAVTGSGGPDAPTNSVLPAWDLTCGLQAALALVSAHSARQRTGQGRRLSLALSDMAMSIVGHLGMLGEAETGQERPAAGNDLYGGFGRDFPTADGRRVMIVALTRKQWRALQKATGLEGEVAALAGRLGADLDDEEVRYRHRDAIAGLVAPWCAARTLAEIREVFDAHRVSWGPYRTFGQLLEEDPRASADNNPLWGTVEHPGLGALLTPGPPVDVAGTARAAPAAAPVLGAHTEEMLADVLGLSSGAIGGLVDRGVVAAGATD